MGAGNLRDDSADHRSEPPRVGEAADHEFRERFGGVEHDELPLCAAPRTGAAPGLAVCAECTSVRRRRNDNGAVPGVRAVPMIDLRIRRESVALIKLTKCSASPLPSNRNGE